MSRQSARDIRYGRHGGGWVDPPRPPSTSSAKNGPGRAPVVLDPAQLFHPATIATDRAHQRRRPGSCASDDQTTPRPVCDCRPDPDDLAEVWTGRARMAAARRAAGVELDAIDVEALRRDAGR